MCPAGRQIEHVAGIQHELLFRLEVGQDAHGHVGQQRAVLLAADAPAALAVRLQQEHVVAVEVRADAAAIAGIADHHVVQTRIGNEAELLHQRMHALVVQVHALHQQRPLGLLPGRQLALGERPLCKGPALGRTGSDEAGFHILAFGQRGQLAAIQEGLEAGDGLAHQQRLALPVAAHELVGRQIAEQGECLIGVHGTIVQWKIHPTRLW